jgi:serine/threonine protein kinase
MNDRSGHFTFPSNVNVSALARDLVCRMIVVDPTQRLSMSQVAKHAWLVRRHAQADLNYALQSMREFNTTRKLKAAAMAVVWGAQSGSRKRLLEIMQASPRPEGFSRSVSKLQVYVSMYLCIHASVYLCIYVSMYLCIYVSMYLCIHVSMCIARCAP